MIISGYNFKELEQPIKWVKFSIDFFDRPVIKKIRRLPGGDTYILLYQKIMLFSAQWGGFLPVRYEPSLAEELSLILDEDSRSIDVLLTFLTANGLLINEAERVYLLTDVPAMIGKDDSTERVRRHRERQRLALEGSSGSSGKKKPMTSAERVRLHRLNKKGVTPTVTTCNENEGDGTLHVTNHDVTQCDDVTKKTLHLTYTVHDKNAVKSQDIGVFTCNDICNVTGNVTETLHETDVTPLEIREKSKNTWGENAHAYTPTHGESFTNPISKESAASLHRVTLETIERYIHFRLESGGVTNKLAFERHIIAELNREGGIECEQFDEWIDAMMNENAIGALAGEFLSLRFLDRNICHEFVKNTPNIGGLHGVISNVMIEIAYQKAIAIQQNGNGFARASGDQS